MAIKRKLLLLLLAIALTPLLVISVFHQVSVRLTAKRLSDRTKQLLDNNAGQTILQLLDDRRKILHREKIIIESLLRRQASEVENRLATAPQSRHFGSTTEFGINKKLEKLKVRAHEYFESDHDDQSHSRTISYQAQGCFLAKGVELQQVRDDIDRLWTMTEVYHEIYSMVQRRILWQYTTLETGLHTNYPAGGKLPDADTYDPRLRPWYINARQSHSVSRTNPIVDASTGKVIVTASMPVYRPDGSFAGVTAIDRTLLDLFENMNLPSQWEKDSAKMIVDLNADDELVILLKPAYAGQQKKWQESIELKKLESEDNALFNEMIAEIKADKPGVKIMPYKGIEAIWAYGKAVDEAIPMLIIPYQRVTEFAEVAEKLLIKESLVWMHISGGVLLVMIAAAVILAAMKARMLTGPIQVLTDAWKRLSDGDFAASVEIKTHDELQQLGQIFNETGPKLKDRESMIRSLTLAGAIQQNLLPKEPPKMKNFQIAGKCNYCDQTGGDYYDFIAPGPKWPNLTGIALGDITGHGIPAALLMASARSSLRINSKQFGPDLIGTFQAFNDQLTEDTDANQFMTLFYGMIDDDDRSFTFASGGHDPAIWYHSQTGRIEELENTGMLMGFSKDVQFDQAGPAKLQKGDIIVIGTDGIWEAQNLDNQMFERQRLFDLIAQNSQVDPQQLCSIVIEAVLEFCGQAPQTDDITMVAIKAV